jgi:hypothetical protein
MKTHDFRFYATGDHYETLATFFGVVKNEVSLAVTRVTNALYTLTHEYIQFPDANERAAIMQQFEEVINIFLSQVSPPF